MSAERICPNCRATVPSDAPEGVCPACALRAGFGTEGAAGRATHTAPFRASTPLPPEELARRLPELEGFERIGQGGMGVVYRARHRGLDRAVAVKVLYTNLPEHASFAERFAREARTLAKLHHPNVVAVHDFGEREGLYYLIMELVEGVNLRQTIEAGGLAPHEALSMVPRICEALQYAHDRGVVHRDIKPENILVDKNGVVKIADFGLAKLMGDGAGPRLTRTAQVMGTPHYMAPEQLERPNEVDHRADIYALGVVLYELLTGELPVGRFPPPSKKVRIDVRLDDVVLRTLEKEPSLRYQQARELQTDVESLSRGDFLATDLPLERPKPPRGAYEFRSAKTVFGLPLVHIAFGRDPHGVRMSVARGIIAIGDVAIGGVAIGGFSIGGISIGAMSAGLVGLGGMTLALLTGFGGMSIGGFPVGAFALGLVARGSKAISVFRPTRDALEAIIIAQVVIWTLAVTVAGCAGVYAWIKAENAKARR